MMWAKYMQIRRWKIGSCSICRYHTGFHFYAWMTHRSELSSLNTKILRRWLGTKTGFKLRERAGNIQIKTWKSHSGSLKNYCSRTIKEKIYNRKVSWEQNIKKLGGSSRHLHSSVPNLRAKNWNNRISKQVCVIYLQTNFTQRPQFWHIRSKNI